MLLIQLCIVNNNLMMKYITVTKDIYLHWIFLLWYFILSILIMENFHSEMLVLLSYYLLIWLLAYFFTYEDNSHFTHKMLMFLEWLNMCVCMCVSADLELPGGMWPPVPAGLWHGSSRRGSGDVSKLWNKGKTCRKLQCLIILQLFLETVKHYAFPFIKNQKNQKRPT